MQPIYEYTDYKKYVLDRLAARAEKGRGERSKLADALKCQLSYISQVLNGTAHFSHEQADILNRHFGHTEEEKDFFLLLLSYARAGTMSLETHYESRIAKVLEDRRNLKNRLSFAKTLPPEVQSQYYSTWTYAAIHTLILIPQYRTPEKIAQYLGLSLLQVTRALDFLVATGLVVVDGGEFRTGPVSIHLGKDSPMINKLHTNWRMRSLQALGADHPFELHYSSIVTISKKDADSIQKALIEAIERVRGLVQTSKDEDLYCYALDFFSLKSGSGFGA